MKIVTKYYLHLAFFIALFFGAQQPGFAVDFGELRLEKVAEKSAVGKDEVKAWDAIKITGLRTDVDVWLPRVSQWIDEGIEFVESGTKVILKKGGNDVGEIVNDILHVKYTGFGADVVCDAGKTTTCVGKWNGGTGTIWNNGLAGQGANPGGVNILGDVPTGLDDLTL